MAQGPSGLEPRFSDDRQWYWNGSAWVPAAQAPVPPPPPSSQIPASVASTAIPRKKGHKVRNGLIALGVLVVIGVVIGNAGGSTPTTSNAQPSPQAQASQKATASAAAPVAPKFTTFGSGTLVVGKDVQAGTYRTRHNRDACYLARLRGFGGGLDDIIANDNTNGPTVVTIAASDKGFQSNRCDTWSSDLSPITTSKTSFGEGMFIVGTDMEPGTYRNSGATSCYWARLSGFGHTLDDIIANGNADAQAVVAIAASDKGFTSSRCGAWTKIG